MKVQFHTRLLAIFAALTLVISLGACKRQTDTVDETGATPTTEPTGTEEPTGGGPNDPSNATEGSGTTTSDPSTNPSTEPSATEPIDDSTEPTGGGPTDPNTPESHQPGAEPADNTAPDDSANEPAGGGPTDDSATDQDERLPNEHLYDSDNSNDPGSGS